MKMVRVHFKIEAIEEIEMEEGDSIADVIIKASESVAQGYDYRLDSWKVVKLEFSESEDK